MQRTVTEVLRIGALGLENPNFKYDKVYKCVASGFPICMLGISNALVSHRHDYGMAVPVYSPGSRPKNIWFENITRGYWG